ncbi:UNVERIFIED_CONTAM: hypothetical protein GTU68_036605 [Idotea baltica]|nr:hypothetical protein [Idotea baltica]
MEALQIIRKGEPLYKDEYAHQQLTNAEWIKVLVKHPKLIERPIFINGDKAIIGRPPVNVLNII